MRAIEKIINQCIVEKKVACVYHNSTDADLFWVGYILANEDGYVLMQDFDKKGRSEGIGLFKTEAVRMLEFGDEYSKNIENKINPNEVENCYTISDFWSRIIGTEQIVEIELLDNDDIDVKGKIIEQDGDLLHLIRINSSGKEDGEAFCQLSDITMISTI